MSVNCLSKHIQEVHQPKSLFECLDCDYKTNNKYNFSSHRDARHNELLQHKCNECSFTAKTRPSLYAHKKSKHKVNGKIHNCNTCSFFSKLRRTATKRGELMFKCYTENIEYYPPASPHALQYDFNHKVGFYNLTKSLDR